MEHSVWLALTTIGAWFAAYCGSYFRTKGENLATHEDIDKLVDQVRAVTTATKEIEAKISNEVWDRQRQWELKREVLFEATKRLAELSDGLLGLNTLYQVQKKENKYEDPSWVVIRHDGVMEWTRVAKNFEETFQLVQVACTKETIAVFAEVSRKTTAIAADITGKDDTEIYKASLMELQKQLVAARIAIRKELGC